MRCANHLEELVGFFRARNMCRVARQLKFPSRPQTYSAHTPPAAAMYVQYRQYRQYPRWALVSYGHDGDELQLNWPQTSVIPIEIGSSRIILALLVGYAYVKYSLCFPLNEEGGGDVIQLRCANTITFFGPKTATSCLKLLSGQNDDGNGNAERSMRRACELDGDLNVIEYVNCGRFHEDVSEDLELRSRLNKIMFNGSSDFQHIQVWSVGERGYSRQQRCLLLDKKSLRRT